MPGIDLAHFRPMEKDESLIPRFGYTSAAAVIACTELVLFVSLGTYTWKQGYAPLSLTSSAKILCASALMGILVLLLSPLPILIVVLLAMLAYGILILLFRVAGDQEKEILSKISMLQFGRN